MALRTVVKIGDDILRKKCREVTKFDDRLAELLDDMYETMMASDGVGLAGPQVGMLRRIAVIDVRDNKHGRIELINPVITHMGGSQTGNEGCLSLPNDFVRKSRKRQRRSAQNTNVCFPRGKLCLTKAATARQN